MDFIIGLPSINGNTVILVVIDRFSKAAHFGSLQHKFTALQAAELFTTVICTYHG